MQTVLPQNGIEARSSEVRADKGGRRFKKVMYLRAT